MTDITTPGEPAHAEAPQVVVQEALSSPPVQTFVTQTLSVIPRRVRGVVYTLGGALASVSSSLLLQAQSNPQSLPEWIVAAAGIIAPIAGALVGGVAWANLR